MFYQKGHYFIFISGTDPGFQVRGGGGGGGGGAHLKRIASRGGRGEIFWGISYEQSRFYAKQSYFFQFCI